MALVSVSRLPGISGVWNRDFTRSYTIPWLVEVDDPLTGPVQILTYFNLTQGASYTLNTLVQPTYEFDKATALLSLRADQVGGQGADGCSWVVVAEYGPYDPRITEDPLLAPADVSWGSDKFEVPVWKDISGNSVVNSAGVRFAEPVTKDDTRSTLTIVRNEPSFSDDLAEIYRDKVNASTFYLKDPRRVKCRDITGHQQFHPKASTDTGLYWVVTYEFEVAADGETWDALALDQGLTQYDSSSPRKRVEITDKNGQPVSEPWPLDGSGNALPDNSGTPVFLTFQVYETAEFADLALENATTP